MVFTEPALIKAAREGRTEEVKRLLDEGAYVDAKTIYDLTALMYAADSGHTDIVKLLLVKGADVNAKDSRGQTAFYLASKNGHSEIVKLLMAHITKDYVLREGTDARYTLPEHRNHRRINHNLHCWCQEIPKRNRPQRKRPQRQQSQRCRYFVNY
jgi:ankyrin repeat protein